MGHWKGEVVWLLSDEVGQWNPEPWLQSHPSQPSTGLALTADGRLEIKELGVITEGEAQGGDQARFRLPSPGGRTVVT